MLTAIMVMLLLAACSKSNTDSNSNNNDVSNPPSSSSNTNDSSATDLKQSTDNSKPVTVNLFAGTSSFNGNLETNWFTKFAEEKFNIKINWTVTPNTDVETKQPILLASGDYPSIFWAGNFTNANLLTYGQQGVFVPLNDLLQKNAPNVWNAIQNTPFIKARIICTRREYLRLAF